MFIFITQITLDQVKFYMKKYFFNNQKIKNKGV